jgi:hypothetical protein
MVSDRTGDVRRALAAGREAVALARTPGEEYQAREWLALIAGDAGRHEEERQQARRLVQLHIVPAITRPTACARREKVPRPVRAAGAPARRQ